MSLGVNGTGRAVVDLEDVGVANVVVETAIDERKVEVEIARGVLSTSRTE
jgi:hypothetical protein